MNVSNATKVAPNTTRVFLSYARADDEPFVKRLYSDLAQQGFSVWWDRVSMPNRGLTFLQEIRDAIDVADRFVLVAGEHAFQSDYVAAEWKYALSICKPINIALRKCDYQVLPPQLAHYDAPDFRDDANYAARLETLTRQLGEHVAALGRLSGVPALPENFIARPDDILKLRDLVIGDAYAPTVITAPQRTTALEGMGGIGKSVLAAAFASDCAPRHTFPDGVLWITAGQKAVIRDLYQRLGLMLGDALANYPVDVNTCQISVENALRDKQCLIVLDDIWELSVAKAFRNLITGLPTRLLITTRNLQIHDLLGAREHRVGLMEKDQALALLRNWVDQDDPDLPKVAEKLDYLPLALRLAGARMLRDKLTAAAFLERFDNVSRLKAYGQATDRDDNLEISINMGVDTVFSADMDKLLYYTFGLFPEDTAVPQSIVLTLWKALRPDLDASVLEDLLDNVVDLALVERRQDATISLHDLLHTYAREKLGSMYEHCQQVLVDACRPAAGWLTMPKTETYWWLQMGFHLSKTGRKEDLQEVLLGFPYLQAKLNATDVNALLKDFSYFTDNVDLSLVASAIRSAAPILVNDTKQLASQLIGRMKTINRPAIRNLVTEAEAWTPDFAWLRPLNAVLQVPTSGLLLTLAGHGDAVYAVQYLPAKQAILTASHDKTVRTWDPKSGLITQTISGFPDKINALAVLPGEYIAVAGCEDGSLQFCDLDKSVITGAIQGHQKRVNALVASRDGKFVISASFDATIKVWDVAGRKLVRTLPGSQMYQTPLALLRNNHLLAAGFPSIFPMEADAIHIWDWESGELIRRVGIKTDKRVDGSVPDYKVADHPGGGVTAVALSPDEQYILCGEIFIPPAPGGRPADMVTARLHAMNTVVDKVPPVPAKRESGSPPPVRGWAKFLAGVFGRGNRSEDTEKRTEKPALPPLPAMSTDVIAVASQYFVKTVQSKDILLAVGIMPDGSSAITTSENGFMQFWEMSGNFRKQLEFKAHSDLITVLAFSPDYLITASKDRRVKLWSYNQTRQTVDVEHPSAHTDKVMDLKIAMDGVHAVTVSADGCAILWDLRTGVVEQFVPIKQHGYFISTAAISVTDQQVVVSLIAQDYDYGDMQPEEGIQRFDLPAGPVSSNSARAAQHVEVVGHQLIVRETDLNGMAGDVMATYTADEPLSLWAMTPDQQTIVAADQSGQVHILRLEGV